MQYTDHQRWAIQAVDQNLQIIACAGSGKTQVISARIVETLKTKKESGVGPGNIVAFTFTDRAAGELKDRIHLLCKETLGSDLGLAEMFVGTIHSYCLNLLQSTPVYRFLKYRVLTEVQQRLLIDHYSTQSGLTQVPLLSGGTLQRWSDSRLYQQLLSVLGEGKVDLRRVPDSVSRAVGQYHALRDSKRYLDYTTIIAEAVAELQTNQTLRDKISTQLKYLVVDEYQDTNPLQEMLIQELHRLGANVCVVGDDDQTVYQWRGSDVSNIIGFKQRYPKVEPIPLNENFRSSEGIVVSARRIAERNAQRLPKRMESTGAQPYAHGDILALSLSDPQEEAAWITRKIASLHTAWYQDKPDRAPRGLTYSDFAILLRSVRNDAGPILEALEVAHIPYIVSGVNGLFDTDEIRAMSAVYFYLADFTPPTEPAMTEERLQETIRAANLGLSPQRLAAGISFLKQRKAQLGNVLDAELYLQRVYLDFLERVELREEDIDRVATGSRTGEIVFYNLGKFSQVISDFEVINFTRSPVDLYPSFAQFLYYQAPDYYPEGWEDAGYAKPDAVQVMTVHQAKGMQWPAVFVPCLRNNRFPSGRHGGRSVWHVIPEDSVENAERYKGTIEDERRLFYVALTRAEKYLFCTWAPISNNRQQRNVSPFFTDITGSEYILTREPKLSPSPRVAPKPRKEEVTLALTFSELRYYFDCPYLFKLRFLYGFNAPIEQALGYGKSLHAALAEIHSESLLGNIPSVDDVPRLIDEHLYLPYASPLVADSLRRAAHDSVSRYLQEHEESLKKLEHVEKVIELKLAEGIVVNGRIDLIRRTDRDETVIVDFKSVERAQAEEISDRQLHVYAVGYEQLTGKRADLIEIHNLDKGGSKRALVDDDLMSSTLETITEAGKRLRDDHLPRLDTWCSTCARCDLVGICRTPVTA